MPKKGVWPYSQVPLRPMYTSLVMPRSLEVSGRAALGWGRLGADNGVPDKQLPAWGRGSPPSKSLLSLPCICWLNPDIRPGCSRRRQFLSEGGRLAMRWDHFKAATWPSAGRQRVNCHVESLISWDKTSLTASLPGWCRRQGFAGAMSSLPAVCPRHWQWSAHHCGWANVWLGTVFPLHLVLWLSKNGKKNPTGMKRGSAGFKLYVDVLNTSPKVREITFNLLSEDQLWSNHEV